MISSKILKDMWIKTLLEATRERKLGRNSLTTKESLKTNHVGGLKMWHTSKKIEQKSTRTTKSLQNLPIIPHWSLHKPLISPPPPSTATSASLSSKKKKQKRLHFHQHPHHTIHFWLFFTLFCAAFRYCFNLSAVPNVSKHIAFLKIFEFTSFMRLGCSSATSNAVYCSARGLLYFEWSKHEMMIAGGCAVNLNWDVCRYILTYPLLYLCTESECPLQVNPIESHPHKAKSRFVVLRIAVFAALCASFALGYHCINIYSTLRLIL